MAVESSFVWDDSYTAGADFSSSQFTIVMFSTATARLALLCTGTSQIGAAAVGVIQNNPTSGHAATVRRLGVTKCSAGSSSIGVTTYLTSSTAGQAISAGTTGQYIWGRAVTASSAVGSLFEAEVFQVGFLYDSKGSA